MINPLILYRPFSNVGGMECLHGILMRCVTEVLSTTPSGGKVYAHTREDTLG